MKDSNVVDITSELSSRRINELTEKLKEAKILIDSKIKENDGLRRELTLAKQYADIVSKCYNNMEDMYNRLITAHTLLIQSYFPFSNNYDEIEEAQDDNNSG